MEWKRPVALLTVALTMLNGCDNVSTEDDPGSVADLCQNIFELCISPILQNPLGGSGQSCASAACHGGGSGGGFILVSGPGFPPSLSPTDLAFNFNSAQSFVNPVNVSQSKLLAEPLVGDAGVPSIGPHGGGDIFNSTAATCYQELSQWARTPNGSCGVGCAVLPAGGPMPADLATCAP